ncbi:TPA: hypothetical protein ACG1QB_004264 [Enterobacter asburiae]|nr:hypothetical protein [Enterobacter asburiae]MDW3573235.1 hypothetical protein [Enterobacter asburiae]
MAVKISSALSGGSISAVAREFGTSGQIIMRLRDDAVSPVLPE